MAPVPRVVVVSRKTDYQLLLERHGTHEQARFFLRTRGQSIGVTQHRHERFEAEVRTVSGAIPRAWRRATVTRADLHRFLFEPGDIVVAIGQDGLVANVAKYLDGQPVIGINPEPDRYDGVLVPCRGDDAERLLVATARGDCRLEARTMVEARLDDGQRLVALNELFLGHRTHQSARYRIRHGDQEEMQSSSGMIVTTGTGATGWARSIRRERNGDLVLPEPEEPRLAFLVREAFPSIGTGTSITDGLLDRDEALEVVSRMNDGGVIFGDGIEDDRLIFGWGSRATVQLAQPRLRLVRAD